MLLKSFKKPLSGLGDGSYILVVIFIYQDYALGKLRKKNRSRFKWKLSYMTVLHNTTKSWKRPKIQPLFHAYLVLKTFLCVIQKNGWYFLILGAFLFYFLLSLNHRFYGVFFNAFICVLKLRFHLSVRSVFWDILLNNLCYSIRILKC